MRSLALPMLAVVAVVVVAGAAACPPRKDTPVPPPAPAASPITGFVAQPGGKRVALLYTASVQGYVEPCGCTGDPLGGIARLGAVVDDARRAWAPARVLFVDGGDLLFEKLTDNNAADVCQAEARADLLVSSYARFGLAATAHGPLDDVRGPSFRDARLAKHAIPTLGVNGGRELVDGARRVPSLVRALGDARVALTAFRVDAGAADDVVARAHEALNGEVKRLVQEERADAVVVLAQAPRDLVKRVVTNVSGVDVVIQARDPGEVPSAPEILEGGAVWVASGQQAQHVGVLELVLDGRSADNRVPLALDDRRAQNERRAKVLAVRIDELRRQVADTPEGPRKQFLAERLAAAESERAAIEASDVSKPMTVPHVVARSIALPRGSPEEPRAKSELAAYTAAIPTLVASCESRIECPAPAPGAKTFVGVAACKGCHAPAFAFWQQQRVDLPGKDHDGKPIVRKSGHAIAWDTLVADKKERDRSCVGCHSVGFGVAGGACKTSDVVPRGLEGVQCESCHGPGSAHAATASKAEIVRSPDETLCRSCHRVPHIPTTESFVFADRKKLVTGPGHGAPPAPPPLSTPP